MRKPILLTAVAVLALSAGIALPHLHAEQMVVGADGVGRYQVVRAADSMVVLVDTKTGRTWQRFVSTSVKAGQWDEITVDELAGRAK